MGDDDKNLPDDPYQKAGQQASEGAGSAVPEDQAADASDELHQRLIGLKRMIAGSRTLQARFADVKTEDEFHDRVVEIGAEHGVEFTPVDSKAFLARGAQVAMDDPEPPAPPPPNTWNCTVGYTCDSKNACSWNPFGC